MVWSLINAIETKNRKALLGKKVAGGVSDQPFQSGTNLTPHPLHRARSAIWEAPCWCLSSTPRRHASPVRQKGRSHMTTHNLKASSLLRRRSVLGFKASLAEIEYREGEPGMGNTQAPSGACRVGIGDMDVSIKRYIHIKYSDRMRRTWGQKLIQNGRMAVSYRGAGCRG